MSESLKKTIALLPEILPKNATSMMQRIVDATQSAIAADPQLGAASYCALLVKMSNEVLVRDFDLALRTSMSAIQQAAGKPGLSGLGLSLSMEPMDAESAPSDADFASSTALFKQLCAKAGSLEIKGMDAYSKDVFLAAFNEAFAHSKIDGVEAKKILPLARQALNGELAKLYAKLDAL